MILWFWLNFLKELELTVLWIWNILKTETQRFFENSNNRTTQHNHVDVIK
jgi:hypothetical protein